MQDDTSPSSTTADALHAAGDTESARDIGALDAATQAVDRKLASRTTGLVERLIYGPRPSVNELQAGGRLLREVEAQPSIPHDILNEAKNCMASGKAFTANGKLSQTLRKQVARHKAYGFTVPEEYGGAGKSYPQLAYLEEQLAANGLGSLAVEISGQLTIGAGSILAYGNDQQKKTYLPLVAKGRLIGFALTEVGVGVNAKKIQAYVEADENGDYRLFAHGNRNKLWITNSIHGALLGLVARIGKGSRDIGLFIIELPSSDITQDAEHDYEFRCEASGVAAFTANHNSRLHFYNFPIPAENRIPADGVEVLFYCLRMGRCMLAAMAAGYQRMLAHDAAQYAIQRTGVGGTIIKHELPRLALGKILGGALQSRALAYLALKQDADGIDLAGLRDITKSAAASSGVESMIACEHVMGGRSFHQGSRVNNARVNAHLFSIVEGEDDMIRMGMVRDVTLRFVNTYLADLLKAIQSANQNADQNTHKITHKNDTGESLSPDERLLRIGVSSIIKSPKRSFVVIKRVLVSPSFWKLGQWCLRNAVDDLIQIPLGLLPVSLFSRYNTLPKPLQSPARFAERKLRSLRWTYLGLSLYYQLELTRAQIPLQRLGQRIEHLTSILATCHHAALQDNSQQLVAALQAQLLKDKLKGIGLLRSLTSMKRTQRLVADVANTIERGDCTLLQEIQDEEFGHPWEPR